MDDEVVPPGDERDDPDYPPETRDPVGEPAQIVTDPRQPPQEGDGEQEAADDVRQVEKQSHQHGCRPSPGSGWCDESRS
jgi:hypothetical protein